MYRFDTTSRSASRRHDAAGKHRVRSESRAARRPWLHRRQLSLLFVGASYVGCAQILDIEEAICDPNRDRECPGGDALSGGTGGSAAPMAGAQPTSGGAAGSALTAGQGGMAGSAMEMAGGGMGAGGTEVVDTTDPCPTYCETMATNCPGEFEQYVSETACLQACETFEPGEPGDSMVNTLSCRQGLAEAAANGEPDFYCPGAGPGGNGLCGSNCDGFCSIMMATCTPEVTETSRFDSLEECLQVCANVPDLSDPESPGGPINYNTDTALRAGNSLQCRTYHVNAAAADYPELHCPHAIGEAECVVSAE